MKKILAAAITLLSLCLPQASAQKLTILHTNDTHSQIDPTAKDLGGVARRKVIIDSVRAAEKNVLLIDAGDAVQGTLYFSLFEGELETKLMNDLGYDIQILGNHEFDNGLDALAQIYKNVNAEKLSSNYNLDNTPLRGMLKPYTIRQIGDKKVGFIAINLIPKGMIADKNSTGVEYKDGLQAANAYAWILKNMEGCNEVVAITHIGYSDQPGYSDLDLAKKSRNIDVIIGGHSHTVLGDGKTDKPNKAVNLDGDTVLIAQTGSSGLNIGQVNIDLSTGIASSKLIAVDRRLDNRIDLDFEKQIEPYRAKVDSVMQVPVGKAAAEFKKGEPALENFMADVMMHLGKKLTGNTPDLAIINKGGLRTSILKGQITKGEIMQVMPFDNYATVMEIKGSDLLDALNVMARRGGDGVSANVHATIGYDGKLTSATISGKPIVPEKTYLLATINYLAEGGDYMTPLKNGRRIATSETVLYDDVIHQLQHGALKGKKIVADNTPRMVKK